VSAGKIMGLSDDYAEGELDLNDHLIRNRAATYYFRVSGDSMVGAGIHDGDLLIVDRSLPPKDGRVVVACVDGDLVVKRLRRRNGGVTLESAHPSYAPVVVGADQPLECWGVVTAVVHRL
jgi:DNA polymerase V